MSTVVEAVPVPWCCCASRHYDRGKERNQQNRSTRIIPYSRTSFKRFICSQRMLKKERVRERRMSAMVEWTVLQRSIIDVHREQLQEQSEEEKGIQLQDTDNEGERCKEEFPSRFRLPRRTFPPQTCSHSFRRSTESYNSEFTYIQHTLNGIQIETLARRLITDGFVDRTAQIFEGDILSDIRGEQQDTHHIIDIHVQLCILQ